MLFIWICIFPQSISIHLKPGTPHAYNMHCLLACLGEGTLSIMLSLLEGSWLSRWDHSPVECFMNKLAGGYKVIGFWHKKHHCHKWVMSLCNSKPLYCPPSSRWGCAWFQGQQKLKTKVLEFIGGKEPSEFLDSEFRILIKLLFYSIWASGKLHFFRKKC